MIVSVGIFEFGLSEHLRYLRGFGRGREAEGVFGRSGIASVHLKCWCVPVVAVK